MDRRVRGGLRVALVATLCGCQATENPGDWAEGVFGSCGAFGRDYDVTFREEVGTCGPVRDAIVVAWATGTSDYCYGGKAKREDVGCRSTATATCPRAEGGRADVVGSVTWKSDRSRAEGSATMKQYGSDGGVVCTSNYGVTFEERSG
jgi:hypothetical protein